MASGLFYKTAFCSTYERLLYACAQSLDAWRDLREEIASSRVTGKEEGDELIRLQANYVKAYSRLEKHKDSCELCGFVAKVSGRGEGSLSVAVMAKRD